MTALALSVFEEPPWATPKERGEGFERRDVDAFQVTLLKQPVGHGERQPSALGELVRVRNAPAVHPRLQVPAYRHGLTVAYKLPLDNTNASVRFPPVLQRGLV